MQIQASASTCTYGLTHAHTHQFFVDEVVVSLAPRARLVNARSPAGFSQSEKFERPGGCIASQLCILCGGLFQAPCPVFPIPIPPIVHGFPSLWTLLAAQPNKAANDEGDGSESFAVGGAAAGARCDAVGFAVPSGSLDLATCWSADLGSGSLMTSGGASGDTLWSTCMRLQTREQYRLHHC